MADAPLTPAEAAPAAPAAPLDPCSPGGPRGSEPVAWAAETSVRKLPDVYPLNSGFGHPAAPGDVDGDERDELATSLTDLVRASKKLARLEQIARMKPRIPCSGTPRACST